LYCVYTLHIVPIYLIIVMSLPLMVPWLEINTFVFVLYCFPHAPSMHQFKKRYYMYYI
jgi:hypothetical protein